jgi:hypothetical protein
VLDYKNLGFEFDDYQIYDLVVDDVLNKKA